MLTKLTKKQEELIPIIRQKYLDMFFSGKKPDKKVVKKGIDMMYEASGYKKPKIIYTKSPLEAQLIANILGNPKIRKGADGSNIRSNIRSNIESNIRSNIRSNIESNIWSNIESNIRSNIRSNIESNIWSNIRSNIWSNIRSNIESNIWSNIRSNIWSNIRSNIRSNIESNIESNIWSNIESNIRSNIWSNIESNIWSNIWSNIESNIRSNIESNGLEFFDFAYYGGCRDLGWVAYFDYYISAGIDIGDTTKYEIFRDMMLGGVYDMIQFENYCIVIELPKEIHQQADNRLSNTKGPAVLFKDGYELFYIGGIAINSPEEFDKIVNDKYTVAELLSIENNDTRAIAYEYFNKEKFASEPHKILDEQIDGKGNPMKIVEFTDKKIGRFYVGICPSTKKTHYIATREITCVRAKEASFGVSDVEFIEEY